MGCVRIKQKNTPWAVDNLGTDSGHPLYPILSSRLDVRGNRGHLCIEAPFVPVRICHISVSSVLVELPTAST